MFFLDGFPQPYIYINGSGQTNSKVIPNSSKNNMLKMDDIYETLDTWINFAFKKLVC